MNLYKQFRVKGTKRILKVYYDECYDSPRSWDNAGILVTSHRRYSIGEETARNTDRYSSWEDWRKHELPRNCVWFPVYMMDHSIQTLSFTPFGGIYGRFDSGQVGYMYTTLAHYQKNVDAKAKKLSKRVKENIKKQFEADLEIMNMYMHGEVFGYQLETQGGKLIDSCWGFYGSDLTDLFSNVFLKPSQLEEI